METDFWAGAARPLRVGLAQIDTTVGDLATNSRRMIEWIDRARAEGCRLVVFPELCLTGYPPEDLVLKPSFIRDNLHYRDRVVDASSGIAVVGGFVDREVDIHNAAFFAFGGKLMGVYHKVYLPNYGVFDEERYFQRGRRCPIFELGGVRVGVSICEDAWYPAGPISVQAAQGCELLVNINGSPYHSGKRPARETMICTRAMDSRAFMVWVNMVGGQDELVFDGNSVVFGPDGELIAHAPSFQEDLLVADLDIGSVFGGRLHDTRLRKEAQVAAQVQLAVEEIHVSGVGPAPDPPHLPRRVVAPLDGPAEIYAALVTGTRDYVSKQGAFEKVLLGLSGGVDSALTAAVAADALGPENVIGVIMPSRFTAPESLEDAHTVAHRLGLDTYTFEIEPIRATYGSALAEAYEGTSPGLAEENVQARIRGNLLMALSNKFGWMVLTTGNKSELATGYCTLYGDMAGGFAVLKDIPKTTVYRLCRHRNSVGPEVIPGRVLTKPPSAELRADQRDEDSLPPYEELDPILEGYVEDDRSFEELVAAGHRPEIVRRVIALVDASEYKRRQGAPGIKITPRAFGRDRRMPITNRYQPEGTRSEPAPRPAAAAGPASTPGHN
ncbi:MAG: NAD+ synthase [Candidatus Dormibacteraeota bacterium]|nr:NAD+ synthase [Candidatus Dormibacteraeota bacterium]